MSLDLRILLRPKTTLRGLAEAPLPSGFRIGCRRPLFLTVVLACLVSLAATSTLTARIALPSIPVWSYVAIVELLALYAVIYTRRDRLPLTRAIDLFFAGHAAWTLLLILIVALIASLPPVHWWTILIRVATTGMVAAIVWSAYIDFWFFRFVFGARPARAIGDVLIHRAVTWLAMFTIFAAPDISPTGFAREVTEAVAEILR